MFRNLILKTQCDTDMAQWQLRASPVVSVSSKTLLTLQHPLQHSTIMTVFLYVVLLVYLSLSLSQPHSTKVSLLSHISSWHLTISKCLSWTAVMIVLLALWVLELSNFSAWNKPINKRRKNGVISFCCEAFNSRHWMYMKFSCCHLWLPSEQAVLGSFDRLFLSQQWWILDIKENSPNIVCAIFGIHNKLQTEELCGSFYYITSQTVHSLYL